MSSRSDGLGAANERLEGAEPLGIDLAHVQPGLQALVSGVRLDGEAAWAAPEREASAEEQAVVITDHFDASTQLGLGVVGRG